MLGLALLAYLMLFHQLGGIGLVGPDEPRYAQISREMVESGDYITPHLMGEPWFEKPVLFYWGAALAYKMFGISEWAARLTSALSGLLGVILVFSLGSKYISRNGGFLAAAILISSPLYFSLARAVSMDMLLTACITGAWGCLYFSIFQERRAVEPTGWQRWVKTQLGVYFFLGLSVLAKGPVGVVLVGGSFCLYLLSTHQWGLLKRLRLRPAADDVGHHGRGQGDQDDREAAQHE
jgi:4-amino-4-deoxy-L-arabinose transferase-like glycosyltransferase